MAGPRHWGHASRTRSEACQGAGPSKCAPPSLLSCRNAPAPSCCKRAARVSSTMSARALTGRVGALVPAHSLVLGLVPAHLLVLVLLVLVLVLVLVLLPAHSLVPAARRDVRRSVAGC